MNRILKIVLIVLLALIVVLAGFCLWYANDYYHAEPSVNALLEGNENVSVEKIDNGLFLDGPGNESALIFYPGAQIEYTSYLPLCVDLANSWIDCFLVEMPLNLAFLGSNRVDSIIGKNDYHYEKWYISGYSLGGSMAAEYVKNNLQKVDGLILLASYAGADLGNVSVLSIYGSEDKVLNKVTYGESKGFIDYNLTEYVIGGGNHVQFASYGNQSKDGIVTISPEDQRTQTEDFIIDFID